MSDKSYALLNNSTDKLDVVVPVNEPTTNTNADSLKTRYIQIAIAVALYWYENCSLLLLLFVSHLIFRFVSISMVFLNKYLLSSKDVKVRMTSIEKQWHICFLFSLMHRFL